MPPKRQARRRQQARHGPLASLRAQVATLQQQQRCEVSSGYNNRTSCTHLYRIVRLQNSNSAANYTFERTLTSTLLLEPGVAVPHSAYPASRLTSCPIEIPLRVHCIHLVKLFWTCPKYDVKLLWSMYYHFWTLLKLEFLFVVTNNRLFHICLLL